MLKKTITIILILTFLPGYSYALRPETINNFSDQEQRVRDIRYWLSKVAYSVDIDIRDASKDHVDYKFSLSEILPVGILKIQNNPKLSRTSWCSGYSSGLCWECSTFRTDLLRRLKETKPASKEDVAYMVSQAIEAGFTDIHIQGEDSLDDDAREYFWAVVDACKDKPVKFVFFTNGIYLLENAEKSFEFFQELKRRLGIVKYAAMVVPWTSEKLRKLAQRKFFQNDQQAVLTAMAQVIYNFRRPETFGLQVFGTAGYIKISSVDVGLGAVKQTRERHNAFKNALQLKLDDCFGMPVDIDQLCYFDYEPNSLKLRTPESAAKAIRQGRVYRQLTVRELLKKIESSGDYSCNYAPFLDVSTSEITTCPVRTEYLRVPIRPETFLQSLAAPISMPRERHLWYEENRNNELAQQLRFALALDPEFREEKCVSYTEVEASMFLDIELMTNIELLFLLGDILGGYGDKFKLGMLPEELIEAATSDEMLTVFLAAGANTPEDHLVLRYSPWVVALISYFRQNPDMAVHLLEKKLKYEIIPKLRSEAIVQPAGSAPADFPFEKLQKRKSLPTLEEAGFDLTDVLCGLNSSVIEKKQKAFTVLASMVKDMFDLNEIKQELVSELKPDNFTTHEQLLLVDLFTEWATNALDHYKEYDLSLVEALFSPFVFDSQSEEVRKKSVMAVVDLHRKFAHRKGDSPPLVTAEFAQRCLSGLSILFTDSHTISMLRTWAIAYFIEPGIIPADSVSKYNEYGFSILTRAPLSKELEASA